MAPELVERILAGYELFNQGRLDEAIEGMPDEIEWIAPEMFVDRGPYRGREGVRRFWDAWHDTFDGFRIEIAEVHDLGEHLVVIASVGGTGRDSGVEVTTPAFPHVWTSHGDELRRMEMFSSEDAARETIGKDWR